MRVIRWSVVSAALLMPSADFPGNASAAVVRAETPICGGVQEIECVDDPKDKCCNGPACLLESKKKPVLPGGD